MASCLPPLYYCNAMTQAQTCSTKAFWARCNSSSTISMVEVTDNIDVTEEKLFIKPFYRTFQALSYALNNLDKLQSETEANNSPSTAILI